MSEQIYAKLDRNTKAGQIFIKVTFPSGDVDNLWKGIVEHCAKDLTENELAKIFDDCNNQIKNTDSRDIPLSFRELLSELQQTIINRKVWLQK